MMICLYVILYLLCGFVGDGFMNAYFIREFPTISTTSTQLDQLGVGCVFIIFGPIGLVLFYLLSGFGRHGWIWWVDERIAFVCDEKEKQWNLKL